MREFDEDKTALGTTVELRQAQGLLGVLQNIYKGVDNMKLHEVPPEVRMLNDHNGAELTVWLADFDA